MTKDDALEKKAENARELGLNYEPEPVAWITEWEGQYSSGKILDYIAHTRGGKVEYTPLYTTPPQRTWVGLTDEEMRECNMDGDFMIDRETAKLNVQAKLRSKNKC